MVNPIISGMIIERRDQVLIGFFSPFSTAASTFFSKCRSINGPFLRERGMVNPRYYLLRRRTINLSVRLLLRVFLPLVGTPQGETG